MKSYFVYMMTNKSRTTLYTGITNSLIRRVYEHRQGEIPGFSQRYHTDRLVCYEDFNDPRDAIAREKQIKKWSRAKKEKLINAKNPDWADLAVTVLGLEPASGKPWQDQAAKSATAPQARRSSRAQSRDLTPTAGPEIPRQARDDRLPQGTQTPRATTHGHPQRSDSSASGHPQRSDSSPSGHPQRSDSAPSGHPERSEAESRDLNPTTKPEIPRQARDDRQEKRRAERYTNRANNNAPIGVFDSGIGGLTVVKELMKALPHEDIIYLGDTEHLPYGNKSETAIREFSLRNAHYLMQHDVKMIVIACNTASAVALAYLRDRIDIPIIGVVESGAADAVARMRTKRIGIIGTKTTIRSGAYARAIAALDPSIEVLETATPLLVHLVEEGWIDRKVTAEILTEYLAALVKRDIDTLILGCTHYPFLMDPIATLYPGIQLVDSARATSLAVAALVGELAMIANRECPGQLAIGLTDIYADIESLTKVFLGRTITPKLVHLAD